MTMIQIRAVGSECRNFKIKSILDDNDDAEVGADGVGVRKNLLYDIRRRVRCDVEIFRRQTADHIADATAREISDLAGRAQTLRDLARSFLHPRRFHALIVAAVYDRRICDYCEATVSVADRKDGRRSARPTMMAAPVLSSPAEKNE